ncbi:U3 small nucleolar RNA-associated protein 4 homolog [Coccinella septempunctata]|uniref:U3 small nucleolar RNA-associated protein 4 homolog n=1 Tax=Coccinella septempunctata TaxID=41139 RepID=UPI001D06A002|nr:U3 small nucleolar RNA-associated protein 4 homolog [Coccinella septempunctata]
MRKSSTVHNIRFYEPKPATICCMSLNQHSQKLAVARMDGSIEIWNVKHSPFIEKTLASNTENYSIDELAWFHDRLFSIGLHGFIIEYDLFKCTILRKSIVTGEAAYCLDIHEGRKQIAVGTEQGYLNIFDIKDDSIMYNKFFDKQEGRILCLKFHSSGSYVASGGLDAIRIWDVETGHALHRMTTGRAEAEKPTIVWCLAFTDNLTVISGDSRGKLTFWDGKVGAQLESYESHKADILSLCISKDESNLYCSGIDPNIHNFVKIQTKGGKEQWIRSMHRKFQDHDVRSLVLNDNKLFSGGSNAYITMSCEQPRKSVQFPPILQNPVITLCKEARVILLRYPKHLEVWTLARCNKLTIKSKPKKIMTLQRLVKNHEKVEVKEGIIFATMSNDSMWIAYGTRLGLRVFQLINVEGEDPTLLRVENIDGTNSIHLNGVFTPDNTQLITACRGENIVVFDISNDCVSVSQRLEGKELTDTITILKVSDDGKYLVAADTASNIVIWKKEKRGSWTYFCKLPTYHCAPVCMDIHPVKENIIISYADNKIIEYSINEREFTKLSKNLPYCLPEGWSSRFYSIRNIFYNVPTDKIVLHDDNSIMVIEAKEANSKKASKKKKLDIGEELYNLKVVKKSRHLIYVGMLSDNEVVAVEVDPMKIQEHLPPVFAMNKFGTK